VVRRRITDMPRRCRIYIVLEHLKLSAQPLATTSYDMSPRKVPHVILFPGFSFPWYDQNIIIIKYTLLYRSYIYFFNSYILSLIIRIIYYIFTLYLNELILNIYIYVLFLNLKVLTLRVYYPFIYNIIPKY